MSFKNYAQFGPQSASPQQQQVPPQASYGNFMMKMLPMMMQQAKSQMQPPMPTPEQRAGLAQSPLGPPPGAPPMPPMYAPTMSFMGNGTVPPPPPPDVRQRTQPVDIPDWLLRQPVPENPIPPYMEHSMYTPNAKVPVDFPQLPQNGLPPYLEHPMNDVRQRTQPVDIPQLPQSPDQNYRRGAYLELMRKGLGR
jgi:hypothetical protein